MAGRGLGVLMVLLSMAGAAVAADYPPPREADWIVPDFRFHGGEVMAPMRLHYTTVGDPSGMPVLVLHGTAGSGTGMLSAGFAGALFGPGQPLDARRYYVILPDALGAGKSAKPSDGMRAGFPHYNYDDMVLAQYRLLTEGLGIRHLRLVIGNSMGGMQAWQWGVAYPGFMDALVPMASTPAEMSGRNWMMRRMLIEAIRRDPASLPVANAMFGIATSGGRWPTRRRAARGSRRTALWTSAWPRRCRTRTTSSTSGTPRGTSIRRSRARWSGSGRRCWPSTRRTTSATRRRRA